MTIDFTLPTIVRRFQKCIEKRDYDFKDDRASSVLDFLHIAYIESKERDPQEISQAFADLDRCMEGLSLDENNTIFCLVCTLCDLYEKRAFQDGLQLGAYLALEIQGK